MKLKLLQTLATAMMVLLCAAIFAVAADHPAPLAPTSVRSVQTIVSPSAPAAFEAAVNVAAASADRAEQSSNSAFTRFVNTGNNNHADANDNRIIGRHSETNELMTTSPPNINQSAFNPTVNRYLIKPVPKPIVTGAGDQRFYRRE